MVSRLNWSVEEQNLLRSLKQQDNIQSWKKISQIINTKFPESARSGKQCRDRYINYVRFNSNAPKIIGWTPEEDLALFEKFQQYGTKWVLISSEMPGRSQNNLKNRFYGAIRKIMRKIVKTQKQMKPKPKKTIKQKQLIKIFEQSRRSDQSENSTENILSAKLFKNLINLAISQQQFISHNEVKNIIQMIHTYTNISRSLSEKKSIQNTSVSRDSDKKSLQDFSSNEINQMAGEKLLPEQNTQELFEQNNNLNEQIYYKNLMESKQFYQLKKSQRLVSNDWPFEVEDIIESNHYFDFGFAQADSFLY